MRTSSQLPWKLAATVGLFLVGSLSVNNLYAKSLYKSVGADGKVTYSNHPTVDRQSAQNVSSLKDAAKFVLSGKTGVRKSGRS